MSTTTPAGSPTWIDLSTTDLEGAKAFYSAVLGWTFIDLGEDMGHYHFALNDGAPIGGLMSTAGLTGPQGGDIPTQWGVFLHVADIEAALTAAVDLTGTIIVPAMPIADQGVMAVVTDPAGAAIGMWQPKDFHGINFTMSPGEPVWFECLSQQVSAALPFYEGVFGWKPVPTTEGEWTYFTNAPEQSATAGICDAVGVVAEGTPSYWRLYLGVADLEAALATVKSCGGAVLDGPVESPYGQVATVADPQGASFQLLGLRSPEAQQ